MGLSVKRNPGEQVVLQVKEGISAEDLLQQLREGITITLVERQARGARINIEAPRCLAIYRLKELAPVDMAGIPFDLAYTDEP